MVQKMGFKGCAWRRAEEVWRRFRAAVRLDGKPRKPMCQFRTEGRWMVKVMESPVNTRSPSALITFTPAL